MAKIFGTLLLLGVALQPTQAPAQIVLDGRFEDWAEIEPLYTDSAGDQAAGRFDFGRVWASHDENYLYLRFELGTWINLQAPNELILFLDADNRATTGRPVHGLGAELEWHFGHLPGYFYRRGGDKIDLLHPAIGLVVSPTVSSPEFELCLDRHAKPDGRTPLFPGDQVRFVLAAGEEGDLLPDAGQALVYSFRRDPVPPLPPISLNRPPSTHLRLMTYNTWREGLFDPQRAPAFARILKAIDPDVVGFEEIRDHSSDQVAAWIAATLGETFHHAQIDDNVAVSRFPIVATFPLGNNGAFLLDLEPRHPSRLLLVVAHLPCCDRDVDRQQEIDEIMAFLRQVKEDGDRFDVESGTPVFIVGDLNLVGQAQQLATLQRGEIADQKKFGPSFAPDWDDTPLTDLCPHHLGSPHTFTWYRTESPFTPGRLDFILYSDFAAQAINSFVLFTPGLPPAILQTHGLQAEDATLASDHLPVVGDFVFAEGRSD